MKHIKKVIGFVLIMLVASCSENFLDYNPKGVVSSDQLNTPDKVDQLVTAAYASLGNDFWIQPYSHLWLWGSVRSDDSYKGGGAVADQVEYHQFEVFNLITVDQSRINAIWVALYEGIGRANEALRRMENLSESEYPDLKVREAECRFLRGHFHFLLKLLFKYPVYADETIPLDQLNQVSNHELTNDELWDKIADDFQFGIDNLPATQPEIGRANKYAAMAYKAKVRLYQAYEQDEQNNVVNINTTKLQEVVSLADNIINSGKYALNDDFAKNFLLDYENGPESIFAIQFSINDGTPNGRIQMATSLNYNMAPPYGCCDFENPSQTLVNAFKTDVNGLPMFDTYNDTEMKDSIDFWTNNVDPRLDHTVGIPTHPFKYDPNFVMQKSWRRVPEVYGYYSTMKELALPTSPAFKKVGPFFGNATNVDILRYDDVLLMKAEALIELGREAEALPLINQIRQRAGNSTEWLKFSDGTYASNYMIGQYVDGTNCTWTQDYARKALRWERRLEFAMEGARFFDLVRWGIAAETLNNYFAIEGQRSEHLATAHFTKGRDEYLPIPQAQIDLTEGLYFQNNGW